MYARDALLDHTDEGSLAIVGEGSGSDRDKRSREVSAPPRDRECETASADSRSFPPRPASYSSEFAREVNTVPFGEGTGLRPKLVWRW